MIWTCKSHDSRVNNYRIHHKSICILMKLSFMMWFKTRCMAQKLFPQLVSVIMSFKKNQVNSAIKIPLIFKNDKPSILHVGVSSKYFVKNKPTRHSWFQNNKKTRKTHVSLKWWFNPQNKVIVDEIPQEKLLTSQHFSQTFQSIISVLCLLIDLAHARDDLLLALSMITFSTKLDLPFAD